MSFLSGDDGVRLFINDELIIDGWKDQPYTQYSVEKLMTAGEHDIKIEYYENSGQAQVKFSYQKTDVGYHAQYFNNQDLSGAPVFERQEDKIAHLFNNSSPDSSVNVGNFSARWTKDQYFENGTHTFYVQSDDGIRVYVDDVLILDDWTHHAMRTYLPSVNLTEGNHEIRVEYFQAGGGGVAIFR